MVPSGWTPFGLLVHLGGVERHWFVFTLDGDATEPPAHSGPLTTLAEAVRAYRADRERSDRILGLELDEPLTLLGPR